MQVVLQPLLLAFKGNPQVKYEKNLMLLPVPLLFSQHWISQVFNIMLPLQSLVLLKEHPDLNYTMKLG